MKDRETPLGLVRLWEKMSPGVYKALDELKGAKGADGLYWPDYCDLPIGAAFTYLVDSGEVDTKGAAMLASELTACYTWRKNKVIYSFDHDFAEVLAAQAEDIEDTDVLPAELLTHMPYPCIFVKTDVFPLSSGFWFFLEYDINTGATELRLQLINEEMDASHGLVLHLIPGGTILDCFRATAEETEKYMPPHLVEEEEIGKGDRKRLDTILSALQFVLYLSSSNADIYDVPQTETVRTGKKTYKIQDKASEVKEKSVGLRIGSAIRKYDLSRRSVERGTGAGTAKRPHSRRGHWHHYWTGPMDGERSLVLKWTAPTFIHQDEEDDTVVMFPVKGGEDK